MGTAGAKQRIFSYLSGRSVRLSKSCFARFLNLTSIEITTFDAFYTSCGNIWGAASGRGMAFLHAPFPGLLPSRLSPPPFARSPHLAAVCSANRGEASQATQAEKGKSTSASPAKESKQAKRRQKRQRFFQSKSWQEKRKLANAGGGGDSRAPANAQGSPKAQQKKGIRGVKAATFYSTDDSAAERKHGGRAKNSRARSRSSVWARLIHGNDSVVRSALDEIATGSVSITVADYNEILSTLSRQRKYRTVMGLIRISRTSNFASVIQPVWNVKTFTIMLDTFGKSHQLDGAFALFYQMQRDAKTPPSQITYNALISACARSSEPELARAVFEDMQAAGLDADKFTYAGLIDAHAKRGDVDTSFEISRLMDEQGVRKDPTIYSGLMEACARACELPRALSVFETMKREGVWPNLITFSVLLDCCANAREPYKAFELFGEIKYWGLTSNVVTWTGLLHACSKAGWPERAEMVLERMRAANVEPNEITFGALVDAWTRSDDMERAFLAIENMADINGIAPNAVLIGGLIETSRRLRTGVYMKMIWNLVEENNLRPAWTYYPTMLALSALSGDTETAVAIAAHSQSRGLLRRVSFRSKDPNLKSLAFALLCVLISCQEEDEGSSAQLEKLRSLLEPSSLDFEDEVVANYSLQQAFEESSASWDLSPGNFAKGANITPVSDPAKVSKVRESLFRARTRSKVSSKK